MDSPIRSSLANDPDYADLVQDFVAEMPSKIEKILRFKEDGDAVQLQRAIHQLRGACGGYGFPQLSDVAASIEDRMKVGDGIDRLSNRLIEFVSMLQRVASDPA